jgi:peptidoglycan/xylan/chitin deacetylase (PgdA/CDA1 family)
VVVLCYHSVHPSKAFASATPALFDRHLAWLSEHCRLVPFSEVLKHAGAASAQDRPVVSITFDDGYADNYEHAFPLLFAYRAPATFFLTMGLIENDPEVVERFCRLRACSQEDVRPLTWSEILRMREGGMEFGTHTWSHPNLARLDAGRATMELARPKETLEGRLREAVTATAYPFGKPHRHFTLATTRIVAATGYELAAAVTFRGVRPSDGPWAVPRFFSTRDSVEALRARVLGSLDLVGAWQDRAPAWLARIVSPEDFAV